MTADASHHTSGEAALPRVETDLPCAKCGYNLRTLPWESKCPECGAAVLKSAPPVGFRFHSQRSENLARWGTGILAAAFLVEVLGAMAMTAAFRVFFVAPRFVYWVGFYAWIYGGWLGSFGRFAAILLLTQPFARATERFKPRFALVAVIFASVGILGTLLDLVLRFSGLTLGAGRIEIVAAHVCGLCFGIAYVLTCAHLLLRVERHQQRALWSLLCPIVAAQVLVLYVNIIAAGLFFSGAAPVISSSNVASSSPWRYLLVDLLWWQKNVVAACWTGLLLA
ncbi:MAG: hypothetical protein ACE5I3_15270, partial [Phycisphaerae bacterium]